VWLFWHHHLHKHMRKHFQNSSINKVSPWEGLSSLQDPFPFRELGFPSPLAQCTMIGCHAVQSHLVFLKFSLYLFVCCRVLLCCAFLDHNLAGGGVFLVQRRASNGRQNSRALCDGRIRGTGRWLHRDKTFLSQINTSQQYKAQT